MTETIPFTLPRFVARAGGTRVAAGDDLNGLIQKADELTTDPDADVAIWEEGKLVAVLFRANDTNPLLMELDRAVI